MKKLSTISLFIFWAVVTSVLTAGLVIRQDNKGNGNQIVANQVGGLAQDTLNQMTASGKSIVLSSTEITKHNKSNDCWIIISGKVYNITSYFGSHPGGDSTMTPTCGIDATAAYATRDPNAKTSGSRIAHSSSAQGMLASYYIGDLNQTIGQQKVTATNAVVAPKNTKSGDDDEWDD
ncbi:MAG: cytochrome b5 domain-containing protein [Candidatus Paceibacterota bacterium]